MAQKKSTALGKEITPDDSVAPVYLIELTAEEESERAELYAAQLERENAEKAQLVARQNALKKLEKLGLTQEEITALIK